MRAEHHCGGGQAPSPDGASYSGGSTTKPLLSLGAAFRPKALEEPLLDDAVPTPAAVPIPTLGISRHWDSQPTQGDTGACTHAIKAFGPGTTPSVLSWVLLGTRSHRRTRLSLFQGLGSAPRFVVPGDYRRASPGTVPLTAGMGGHQHGFALIVESEPTRESKHMAMCSGSSRWPGHVKPQQEAFIQQALWNE